MIWEAFKEDTEVTRATRQDDLVKQRDALIAAIRRGARAQEARPAAEEEAPAEGGGSEGGAEEVATE